MTIVGICLLVYVLLPMLVCWFEKRSAARQQREPTIKLSRLYLWLLLATIIVFAPMALLRYLLPDMPSAVAVGFVAGFALFIAILLLSREDAEDAEDAEDIENHGETEPNANITTTKQTRQQRKQPRP